MELRLLLIALVICFIPMISYGGKIPYNQRQHNSAMYTINDIGNKSKDVCYAVNVIHSADNENVPYNLTDAREHYKGLYKELGKSQSILHNFRPDVQKSLTTPEARIEAAVNAFLDFHTRPKALWTVLDPDLPNVKFVEINGHKEVVYNKHTGEKVTDVNAGTFNKAINQSSDIHALVDVPLWFLCGTPTETQEEFARILSKDEKLYNEFSKVKDSIVNDFMKSFGMDDDTIRNFFSVFQSIQAKEEKEKVSEMFSRPVSIENSLARIPKTDTDMRYNDAQKDDKEGVNNSNKDNVNKTDFDEAKNFNDKGITPEAITVGVKGDGVDLSQFDRYVQEIILGYKEFNSTLEECVELSEMPIDISGENSQASGLRGVVARGNAIEAEKKARWRKWQTKYEKSIRKLNDKTLALENTLQSLKDNISLDKMVKIRKTLFRPVLPYIRKTLEIAKRADPDIADSIIKQFSALEKFISDDDTKFEY